ncbi:uncharacterized protein LAJ45_01451 [Morchella importuna]|uniref:uncharacterized protein n=1 Tax=Morchella importuna TaxID=1174673 RepID=UPI001E8D0AB5|nr:uncharacterized protein LAJ45_01451 [Morchella importuna]KAH8154919.1 hypothetical protein LAJ45_01451 [Morchella importuna]
MPSKVRTIFHVDPTTDVCSPYTIFSTLTAAHATTIAARWRRKTIALRTKCLSRAWAAANGSVNKTILERRPRLSDAILKDRPISELIMDELLYACINLEQLATNPATILNFVCSRAVCHPSAFGREDYRCIVRPILELFGVVNGNRRKKGKVEVVVIMGDETEYGVLKTYAEESREYTEGVRKMLIAPVEVAGVYLMRWQKTILEFCLALVKDIISPIDPKKDPPITTTSATSTTSKLLENVPNYSLVEGGFDSYSASILLRPYTLPPITSIADAYYLAVSHLRAAEDHLGLLHTNSNYFIAHVTDQLTHKLENTPARSPLAIHDALHQVLYNANALSLIWGQVCLALEDAGIDNESNAELANTINPLLAFLEGLARSALKLHFLTARESKTENAVNHLLIIAVEIEHLLADTPLLKPHVDPYVMSILSSVAAICEIREAACRVGPSTIEDNQASAKFGETLQELSQLWEKVEFGSFSDVSVLQESTAGDWLKMFWGRVSTEFEKLSGKTIEAWIINKQGRIVDRRKKGKWHWQGNVWMSEKLEYIEEYKKAEGKLPELVGIAEWDDVGGYGEPSPVLTNGGNFSKMIETSNNQGEGGDAKRTTPGAKPDSSKKISVTKRMYNSIMHLSNGTPVPWKDFVHLMTNLGFTMEHKGGNLVRLIPATKWDEAMVVKRPHPETTMQSLECVFTWTRLEQCYGWKVGIFEKHPGTTEVKVVGGAPSWNFNVPQEATSIDQ